MSPYRPGLIRRICVMLALAAATATPPSRAAGSIRVAAYESPPYAYQAANGPAGLEIDMLEDVARIEGWELDIEFVSPWTSVFEVGSGGRSDAGTEPRSQLAAPAETEP